MPPSSRRPSARVRILDSADRMFYDHGIRAVGVEAIVAAADTAKTTLYGHFGSKDELVVAYLQRRATREQDRIEHALAAHGGPAAERVLHLFDLLGAELTEPGYRGSPFLNACVELGTDHPAAAVARRHRQWLLDALTALAVEAAAPAPDVLAAQLLALYEASTVATQIGGDTTAAHAARQAADALLSAAQPDRAAAQPDRAGAQLPPDAAARRPEDTTSGGAPTTMDTTAGLPAAGSPQAHRLVALLNSAHLPDGDDQLADERAERWLKGWLADAGAPATGQRETTGTTAADHGLSRAVGLPEPGEAAETVEAAAELLLLREGLRQLAAVNCGAHADPRAVAQAATVLERAPLVVDLACGAEPRLTGADDADPARRAVAAAAEAYLMVRASGEWARLKVCASRDCRWAFLDTTRNRSRRWCDMAGCGNRAKNRAWRDRQDSVTVKIV